MAGTGGPWGGGGNSGGGRGPNDGSDRGSDKPNGGRRPGGQGSGPGIREIDDLVRKGQDQLRVLMGGRGGGPRGPNGSGDGGGGFEINRTTVGIAVIAVLAFWLYQSFYTVRPEERSVELFLGDFQGTIGQPGLNFAPWPVVTAEVVPVTTERTVDVGVSRGNQSEDGLMLTLSLIHI